jgi:hypothetical protein
MKHPCLPDATVRWDDFSMSENRAGNQYQHSGHQHAHTAPTTQQMRIVGQRRREAEEKLEHHLQEARRKEELHPHGTPDAKKAD